VTRRGCWEAGWIFVLVVFFLVFRELILGLFAAQFTLNLMDVDPDTVLGLGTLAFLCDLAHGEPAVQRKVHSLGAVVTEIVTRVISIGVGNHKFSRIRDDFIHLDVEVLKEVGWRDQEGFVTQELVTCLGVCGPDALHGVLKPPGVGLGYAVPLLWGTEMQKIDAVEVDILKMPCKCRFPHAQVEIGRVHAGHLGAKDIQ
jgi:hypothetical protein